MKSTEKYAKMAKDKGYSLREFAAKTGVSDPYWSLLLKRGAPPSIDLGERVSEVLPLDKKIVQAEIVRDRILWLLQRDKEIRRVCDNELIEKLKNAIAEIDFESLEVEEEDDPPDGRPRGGRGLGGLFRYLMSTIYKTIDNHRSASYKDFSGFTSGGCLNYPKRFFFTHSDPRHGRGDC